MFSLATKWTCSVQPNITRINSYCTYLAGVEPVVIIAFAFTVSDGVKLLLFACSADLYSCAISRVNVMCHFDCSDRRYEDSIIAKPWLIKENSKVSHFSVWMITWSQKHLSWADGEFRYLLLFKLHAHTFERLSMSLTSYTGEIDRCLKKVAEGVEQFEDIWQKVSKVDMWFWLRHQLKEHGIVKTEVC